MKAKAVQVTKTKRKDWYSIIAPKEQNAVVLGETFVSEPESAVGRITHANLKLITDNMRDQNSYLTFKINSYAGKNFHTELTGYYLTPPSVRKITRRNTSRIDESFVVTTKDSKNIRVKPIAITIKKTVRSIESALRESMKNGVAREAAESTFIEFIQKVINHSIQNNIKKRLTKVYPLRAFDIKNVEIAREGRAVKAKEEKEAEPKEETGLQADENLPKKGKKKAKKTVSEEMTEQFESQADELEAKETESTEDFGEEKQ